MKPSVFLVAFLPWGVLAPLNVIKLLLNTVSPTAHLWVPKETEQCQAACGIARMWATLFWSLQFVSVRATTAHPAAFIAFCAADPSWPVHRQALSFVYVHYHREQTGLVYMGIATKLVVGILLLKAYLTGVIHWPIGLGGPCCDWVLAALFALELRGSSAQEKPWAAAGQLSFLEDELKSSELKKARLSLRNGELPEAVSQRLSGRDESPSPMTAGRPPSLPKPTPERAMSLVNKAASNSPLFKRKAQ